MRKVSIIIASTTAAVVLLLIMYPKLSKIYASWGGGGTSSTPPSLKNVTYSPSKSTYKAGSNVTISGYAYNTGSADIYFYLSPDGAPPNPQPCMSDPTHNQWCTPAVYSGSGTVIPNKIYLITSQNASIFSILLGEMLINVNITLPSTNGEYYILMNLHSNTTRSRWATGDLACTWEGVVIPGQDGHPNFTPPLASCSNSAQTGPIVGGLSPVPPPINVSGVNNGATGGSNGNPDGGGGIGEPAVGGMPNTGGIMYDANHDGQCTAADGPAQYPGLNNLAIQLFDTSGNQVGYAATEAEGTLTQDGNYIISGNSTESSIRLFVPPSSLLTGDQVLGVRVGGQSNPFDYTGYQLNGYTFQVNPSTHTESIDICIGGGSSWFQTTSGDVRMGYLTNIIPPNQKSTLSSRPHMPLFTSLYSDVILGSSDLASSNVWEASNEYALYNNRSAQAKGSTSYDYYLAKAKSNGVTIGNNPCMGGDTSNCIINLSALPPNSGSLYNIDGDVTLDGYTQASKSRVTILVNGNLTIDTDILPGSFTDNTLTIFSVKKDITVNSNVGNSSSNYGSSHPNIRAILTAEGNITIQSKQSNGSFSCTDNPDNQLVIEGVLIANSLRPWMDDGSGEVNQNRSLCRDNANTPALIVKQRYGFLTSLTDFYKMTPSSFTELQP